MRFVIFSVLIISMSAPVISQAMGIQIGRTRVIYDADKKEVPLAISNKDEDRPWLIQSWTDTGDNKTHGPFIVTPPLFRLDPQKEQNLRITWSGARLPEDRESLFYINIRAIPASATADKDKNTLRVNYKTRLKLFWRPAGLEGSVAENCRKLGFSRQGNQLRVTNNGAYYSVFDSLHVGSVALKKIDYVAPKSTIMLALPANATASTLTWHCITDYGSTSAAFTSTLAGT